MSIKDVGIVEMPRIDYLEATERDSVFRAQRLVDSQINDPIAREHVAVMLEVLTRWRVRAHGILVTLLLPLTEEGLITLKEVEFQFGFRAAQTLPVARRHIYDSVATPGRKSTAPPHAESLRELFVYAFADIEVALICLADQLAGAATLNNRSEVDQRNWAQKNMAIYDPLLEMLGMLTYRRDLGNLALAVHDMAYYEELEQYIWTYYQRTDALFAEIKQTLGALFQPQHIPAEIALFPLSPVDLRWRLIRARRRGEYVNVGDIGILQVDVLLETEEDCYRALGVIHNQWRPAYRHSALATGRFHDYIAMPRYNGYRCLITTVLCGHPAQTEKGHSSHILVEFHLLTPEMQRVNSYGIVATMEHPLPIKNVWWANITLAGVINPHYSDPQRDALAVFTPTGEVIYPLHKDSTMIDFAFRVSSALGPYARRFWVNGQSVLPQHPLGHCDLAEVEYDTQYPSLALDWTKYARSSLARTNIRRFLKASERLSPKGRKLIDAVLRRESEIYRMRFPEDKIEQSLEKIARRLNCDSLENLYIRVGEGNLSPDVIVAAMIESELVNHIVPENGKPWPPDRIRIAQCWMQEKEPVKWERDSRVLPGVAIVGRSTGDPDAPILMVHRRDCRNAPTQQEAIPLRWGATTTLREAAEITIIAPPRANVLSSVLDALNDVECQSGFQGFLLHRFHADAHNGNIEINLLVDAPTFVDIQRLRDSLRKLQEAEIIQEVHIWQLFPGQKMLIAGRTDKRQQNPYTLRQIRDRNMFFGREEEIAQIIELVQSGQLFIVLYGQKRIGKTSLLYQLAENLLPVSGDVLPVLFDTHVLAPFNAVTFLAGLAEATDRVLVRHLKQSGERQRLRLLEKDLQTDPFREFAAWVKRVQQRLLGTKLLFIVDEFTRAEEEYRERKLHKSFFDGIQWLVGNQNIGFLFCVHDTIYNVESGSWGMLQRGQPIRLDTLDYPSAARLVRQPLERIYKFNQELVDRILALTNCHPYFIHALGMALTGRMSTLAQDEITLADLDSAMTVVLKTGDHYFSHFYSPLDAATRKTLIAIAYTAGDKNTWVSQHDIRAVLENCGIADENWGFAGTINQLYRAGILEARHTQREVSYRIAIDLFQIWLRQQTNPLITGDMQRKDSL